MQSNKRTARWYRSLTGREFPTCICLECMDDMLFISPFIPHNDFIGRMIACMRLRTLIRKVINGK